MDFSLNEFNNEEMKLKKENYLKNMNVTALEIQQIMNIPQRTPDWIKWRSCRMTASNYGSAVGHNPYQTPKKLLQELLWSTFKGNRFTEWGTDHEPVAAKIYENFLTQLVSTPTEEKTPELPNVKKASFYYPGLIISQDQPWLAVSPDGLPGIKKDGRTLRFLLEIKCPATLKLYPHIPHYYFDQIQGIMGILQLPFCDFVVWTPDKTQIRRYNFDLEYWRDFLFPSLYDFYMEQYLPRLILKEEGKLKEGELEPVIHLEVKPSLLENEDVPLLEHFEPVKKSKKNPRNKKN